MKGLMGKVHAGQNRKPRKRLSKKIKRISALVLLAALFVFLINGTAYADYVTTQLTGKDYYDYSPQINASGQVVWQGYDGHDFEIFLFSGGVITQLSNNYCDDELPRINDSGQVTWYGNECSYVGPPFTNICLDEEIFLYSGGVTTQLTHNNNIDSDPQINNNGQVVWRGWDGQDYEFFLYSGGVTTQLTNNNISEENPQLNASGQVVWLSWDGTDNEIFLYSSGVTTKLTNNSYYDYSPQINASGQVVWDGYDGTDYEIYLYSGGVTTQLTSNTYTDAYPQINDNGQVVWSSQHGYSKEIVLYSGGTTTQLTNNLFFGVYNIRINNNGQVVWHSHDGTDFEIYIYSGGVTTQLTSNTNGDFYPQINDSGQVVWGSSNIWIDEEPESPATTEKIFLASSSSACAGIKPSLTLSLIDPQGKGRWESYADYLAGSLSVDYRITNTGADAAYAVKITGSTGTSGVTCLTTTPVSLGTLGGGGGSGDATLKYNVSSGAGSFWATVNAQAQDACGTSYTYS